MKYTNHVIENIKYLRKKYKISQVEFAKKAGVTQATINRWEKGLISPTIDNLFSVCDSFHVNMGDLICKDLSIEDNQYDEQIKKIASENGVEIIIDKNAPLTAETVVDIQKVLMKELENEKENKNN